MNKILDSFRKNKKGIALMLLSSVCVCFGQLFWKLSAMHSINYLIFEFVLYAVGALVSLPRIVLAACRFCSQC